MKDQVSQSASAREVRLTGGLWGAWQKIILENSIPYQWSVLNDQLEGVEKSGAIENFRIAAGESGKAYYGTCFQDSDVGKWLEGVAYSLAWAPDERLERTADEVIELIGRAQRPDGYINTYFTVAEPDGRLKNIRECNELYCFGHLAEAAVAYAQATGKRRFLDIVCQYADFVCGTFGAGEGQIPACDGHPEAELALVRLYEATGRREYLEQAGFQLDIRGAEPYYYDLEWERRGRSCFHPHLKGIRPGEIKGYDLSECPPRKLERPVGHAVKLCYLLSGMAAYSLHTGDGEMFEACRRVFRSIRDGQMYITGAVGATRHMESFTREYHLPNDRSYAETCASVALAAAMRWMLRNEPRAEYADVMERVLYNACLAGASLDGRSFFYANPLEVYPLDTVADPDYEAVKPVRQKWFWCACCPPNLVRLVTGLGEYLYTHDANTLYVHLFASSEADIRLSEDCRVSVLQETDYPWDGRIRLVVRGNRAFRLGVRIPGWCEPPVLAQDGQSVDVPACVCGGYAMLDCPAGESEVLLCLDMTPYAIEAHPRVKADAGKVAVMRGPVVYCAEEADNGPLLHCLAVDPEAGFEETGERFFGAPVLRARRAVREKTGDFEGLYRRCRDASEPACVRLIPYGLWGNRLRTDQPEEMAVWLRRTRL